MSEMQPIKASDECCGTAERPRTDTDKLYALLRDLRKEVHRTDIRKAKFEALQWLLDNVLPRTLPDGTYERLAVLALD